MKYGVIAADPPWHFKNFSILGESKNPVKLYPCLAVETMARFPVAELAAEDCALFLWVTGPFLQFEMPDGRTAPNYLAHAWGFPHYSGTGFVWVKHNPVSGKYHFGPGYGTRKNVEFCLHYRRGKPKRQDAGVPELLVAPRGAHSEKPSEAYLRMERLVAGPYCELFARKPRGGWTVLGNEIDGLDLAEAIRRHVDQPSLALEGASL